MNNENRADSNLLIGQQIEQLHTIADPAARTVATGLVASVLELHRLALARMLELLKTSTDPNAARAAFEADNLIQAVLLLHDLHSKSLDQRIQQTLSHLGPRLQKFGATAEIVQMDEDGVKIRIRGTEKGCGSTAETVRSLVAASLADAAPDACEVVVELAGADRSFIPVESIHGSTAAVTSTNT